LPAKACKAKYASQKIVVQRRRIGSSCPWPVFVGRGPRRQAASSYEMIVRPGPQHRGLRGPSAGSQRASSTRPRKVSSMDNGFTGKIAKSAIRYFRESGLSLQHAGFHGTDQQPMVGDLRLAKSRPRAGTSFLRHKAIPTSASIQLSRVVDVRAGNRERGESPPDARLQSVPCAQDVGSCAFSHVISSSGYAMSAKNKSTNDSEVRFRGSGSLG